MRVKVDNAVKDAYVSVTIVKLNIMHSIKPELNVCNRVLNNLIHSIYHILFHAVTRDVAISMIPQMATLGLGLVSSILIARGLGPAELGRYTLIISLSSIAVGLSDLGISRTALRYASIAISNGDAPGQYAVLRWAFKIRMILVLSITAILILLAPVIAGDLWHSPDLIVLIWMSLFIGVFSAIAIVPTIYFQSLKRFKMNALVMTAQSIITFIGILVLLLLNGWRLEFVLLVTVLSTGIGAFFFILSVPKESIILYKTGESLSAKFKNIFNDPTIANIKTMDKINPNTFAIFMVITSIISLVSLKVDVWLMGIFLDKSEIGVYSIATYFTYPITAISLALNTVLWPHVSALKTKDSTITKLKTTLLITTSGTFLLIIYSIITPLLIPYLFGTSYTNGVLIAQVLCIAYSITIIYWPMQVFGINLEYVRHYWWINLIQLVVIVVINVIFLPKIGAIASGIALLVSILTGLTLTSGFILYKICFDAGLQQTSENRM